MRIAIRGMLFGLLLGEIVFNRFILRAEDGDGDTYVTIWILASTKAFRVRVRVRVKMGVRGLSCGETFRA